MRLRVVLVVCTFVGITSLNQLHAQFIDGQYVLGSGLSASFIYSDSIESTVRPGFNCSFGYKYELSDKYGLLAYFDFSNMGAKVNAYKYDVSLNRFSPATLKLYYSYFMVDYLVSYKLQEPLSVQLGGCFGAKWLRSREIDYDYYTNNSQDFSDNYSYGSLVEEMFMDYGLVAGITAGNEDVQFCLNYKHYFRNMFAGYMTDYTAHNGVLELKILVLTDFGY